MDAGLKARWVEALRGGKYRQGKGCLRDDQDNFCCLGVLCDVSGQGQWNPEESSLAYQVGSYWNSGYFPEGFGDTVGIGWDQERKLSSRNDRGETFASIASYIEENL